MFIVVVSFSRPKQRTFSKCVRTIGPSGGSASDDRITEGSELCGDGTGTQLLAQAVGSKPGAAVYARIKRTAFMRRKPEGLVGSRPVLVVGSTIQHVFSQHRPAPSQFLNERLHAGSGTVLAGIDW